MSEEKPITPEMIAAYQRQQQMAEQAAMQTAIRDLIAMAAQLGFEIAAIPQLSADGRITAVWGLQRKS